MLTVDLYIIYYPMKQKKIDRASN